MSARGSIRRPPPRRRRGLLPLAIALAALAVVFAAGLAVGDALDDNPLPGRTQTSIRTLRPLEVPPAPETVTVTVGR